jgi:hypothetical protein
LNRDEKRIGLAERFNAPANKCSYDVDLLRCSEQPFDDKENNRQQEYDNGDLVDPVHHLDIDIGRPIRILPPKEISANFS